MVSSFGTLDFYEFCRAFARLKKETLCDSSQVMSKYPDIYVLRHGETVWNRAGRFQGQGDSPLTAKGQVQAGAQNQLLKDLVLNWGGMDFYSSPLGRCVETAELALSGLCDGFEQDLRLREVDFGAWEGLTLDEIERGWPELDHEGNPFMWNFISPGGEAFEEISRRVESFLGDLKRPSVIVSHGITGRILRGLWLGLDHDGMADLKGGQGNVHCLSAESCRELRQS